MCSFTGHKLIFFRFRLTPETLKNMWITCAWRGKPLKVNQAMLNFLFPKLF